MAPNEFAQNFVRRLLLFSVAALLLVSPSSLALSVPVEVALSDGDATPITPDDVDLFDIENIWSANLALAGDPTVSVSGDSTINQCEIKQYTISIQNNSGSPLTNLVVTGQLGNFTGFSYYNNTPTEVSAIDVDGTPICNGGGDNSEPVVSGTDLIWNIDARCPNDSPFTLANGETLNISFWLQTDCTAESGSLNVQFDYQISGTPTSDNTGAMSIQVNPGAVNIRKEPTVIPQVLGQDVTWTLTVENTGFGVIENVEVTDVLGAGLAYVSSTQNGDNSDQTTTWTSNDYAALASMNPGDILTMDITATVIAGDNLDNTADVRFGCYPSPTNTCWDTSTDDGTARASVQSIVRTPVLAFTPPNINFTYCSDTENVAFTITNNGDGIAYDVYTIVDLTGFTVSDVSAWAIYNAGAGRFELAAPLAATGGSYNLSFDLTYNTWCGGSFPSGDLLWQSLYKDERNQDFYPPVELSTINAPASSSSLAVAKTGAPSQIEIGGSITYNVTSSYTGQLNCDSPSNPTGLITVVDTLPAGLVPTSFGGGVWHGGARTLTWTYFPPATLNVNYTVDVPTAAQCGDYCNTTFTNSVTATGTDCCGCAMSASASQTTAIECEGLVDSEKTAVPATGIRCDNIQYTNTYVFADNATLDNEDVSQLVFQEDADNEQEYVAGSLAVTLTGVGDITACATSGLADTTPGAGGNLIINFSGCSGSVRNRTLTITYQLTITEDAAGACSGAAFDSRSSLDLDLDTGNPCLLDEIIDETTVAVDPPAMSLSLTGLGQIVHKCESQTVTLTLSQTSNTADPKDVRLVLAGLNYYVVNPAATICGGVAPVSRTPAIVGDDYVWEFGDAFTGSGQSATLQLDVQKRCTGSGDLAATAYFDDNCNDDATFDDTCSTTATETPALLLKGDLLIEKTPETYYATTNTVQWEIYLTNRGTGTAYNVWVDDVLGAGLIYEHGVNPAVVSGDNTGVFINDSLDHDSNAINGVGITIPAITAGERRQITMYAKQINCTGLTNNVTANWGCINVDCQTDVTDSSIINMPAPNLINTNTVTPAGGVNACENPRGFITLKNAGQIYTYNLQVTETLPTGLTYVPGSTQWRINGGAWNGPNATWDPSPTVSPLVWTSTQIPQLAQAAPGDTIEIEFDMVSDCPFSGGTVTVATRYENPCATVFNTTNSTFPVAFLAPDISITKTLDPDQPIGCNQTIFWDIVVTNDGSETLDILWLEDTLDAAFNYIATTVTSGGAYISDTGFNPGGGQVVQYEITDLPAGQSVELRMAAQTDQASDPCSANTDNTVLAWWGCGNPDGSSATKPGVNAPDAGLCLGAASVSDTSSETRQPTMSYLSVGMSPASINSCVDSSTITVIINNTGPTDSFDNDLVLTLPAGLSYNPGSSQNGLGTDQTSAIADLSAPGTLEPSGTTILTWGNVGDKATDLENVIDADGGNDTLVLRFTVQSSCYLTSNLVFAMRYYDCCGLTQYNTPSTNQLIALNPDLAVTKTADLSQVVCGSDTTYTIAVTNNGTGNAQVVRVVDTLGPWLDWNGNFTEDVAGTVTPAQIGADPQVWGWEFNNLGPGATATFTFRATLNPDAPQDDCDSTLRDNDVEVVWACGDDAEETDNDPTTADYDCTDPTSVTAGPVTLQLPNLVVTSITPSVSCTSDGASSGSISVRVTNTGDGDTGGTTFTVEVTDGKGWTGTGTYSNNIAAGGFADVTINTGSWTPDCQPCGAPYSFNATVDPAANNDICECNETDNTTGSPTTYTVSSPDLVVDADTLTVVRTDDGQVKVTGTVTLGNNGCNTEITSTIPMRFTLYDNTGCAGSVVEQWTETFSSVNISAGGGTQAFTITNHVFTSDMCADSTGCQVSIFDEADYTDAICECDGTNNTYCADKNINIPDIEATNDSLTVTCLDDGQVTVSGTSTLTNNGCGSNLNANIPMRFTLYDNTGCAGSQTDQWTQTYAGVNIASGGGAQVFAITPRIVTSNLVTNSTGCQVSIREEADYTDAIFESDGTDNTYCADNKSVNIPDLTVNSVTPFTAPNGDGTVTVNVSNTGCGDANGAVVRLTSDCGLSFSDQTVDLTSGSNADLIFSFTLGTTNCTFTANIDPDNAACECDGANNARSTMGSAITIVKDAVPDAPQDFDFTGDLGSFELDDDPGDATLPDSRSFVMAAATYSVTEASIPAGWNLAVIVCDDPDGGTTTNLSTATATIDLDAGEIITCTFTNAAPVPVTTATGTGIVTFESDKGVIQDLTALSEGTLTCPAEGESNLVFRHGFFSFHITGLTPCASETVVVTITLPSAVPVGTEYWKCYDGAWLDVTSLLGENDGDNVLTLTLTDGGMGDDDGVCDGVIVDDGGPGQQPTIPIGGIAVPVNKLELIAPWIGLAALASLVALTVALVRRRRG